MHSLCVIRCCIGSSSDASWSAGTPPSTPVCPSTTVVLPTAILTMINTRATVATKPAGRKGGSGAEPVPVQHLLVRAPRHGADLGQRPTDRDGDGDDHVVGEGQQLGELGA